MKTTAIFIILVLMTAGCICPEQDRYKCNDNIAGECCKTHAFDNLFNFNETNASCSCSCKYNETITQLNEELEKEKGIIEDMNLKTIEDEKKLLEELETRNQHQNILEQFAECNFCVNLLAIMSLLLAFYALAYAKPKKPKVRITTLENC